MRLPRLASLPMIALVVLLTACSSSGQTKRPNRASTTTSKATSTTSVATSSTTTTVPRSSVPPTTSTVSALGGPRIVSLTGPPTPVQCNAPTSVELHWETRGATAVTLRIDRGPVFATYRDGTNDKLVPLACDGKAHTYTLTALAADGKASTKALTLTEHKL